MSSEEEIKILKSIWYDRNPSHESNANSNEDMFFGTILCVFKDFKAKCEPVKPVEDEIEPLKHDNYNMDKYNEEQLKHFLSTPETVKPVIQSEVSLMQEINQAYNDNWQAQDEVDTDAEGHPHYYESMDYERKFDYEQFGRDVEEIYLTLSGEYAAQQAKQPVMQWVKAIERLPVKGLKVFWKRLDRNTVFAGYDTFDEVKYMDLPTIEWLEEPLQSK